MVSADDLKSKEENANSFAIQFLQDKVLLFWWSLRSAAHCNFMLY